jgi:hypothetical protein
MVTLMEETWATRNPLALLHIFPPRLWPRTGLAAAEPVVLSALFAGTPNKALAVEDQELVDLAGDGHRRLPTRAPPGTVPVPVLGLDDIRALIRWTTWLSLPSGIRDPECCSPRRQTKMRRFSRNDYRP